MVPADADDIAKEYEILLDELRKFNPDLVDKQRVLAVSKSDMLDDELREEIAKTLPEGVPSVFISAVTGQGITELKDMLWRAINDENNRIAGPVVHRPLDKQHRVREEDEFIFEYVPTAEEEEQEAEDLRNINPGEWGDDIDWDDAEPMYDEEEDVEDADDRADDDEAFLYEAINDK